MEYKRTKECDDRITKLENMEKEMKGKVNQYLETSLIRNKDKDSHRPAVRVSCIQESEARINEESQYEDSIDISLINTPDFISYLGTQNQRYESNKNKKFNSNSRTKPQGLKLPAHPSSTPLYKTQLEVAKFWDEIKDKPCFLHAAGKEPHSLWECGMKTPLKMEMFLILNQCRKCGQPGHIGNSCEAKFIPICEECNSTGHLKIFCNQWLKEKAKEYGDKRREETEMWTNEQVTAKQENKTDPKVTEYQAKKIEITREYKPTVMLVQHQDNCIPNPQDPVALS
jgi:hypothetical protein